MKNQRGPYAVNDEECKFQAPARMFHFFIHLFIYLFIFPDIYIYIQPPKKIIGYENEGVKKSESHINFN